MDVTGGEPDEVVPHAGTWIEIMLHMKILYKVDGRSPRGNVD